MKKLLLSMFCALGLLTANAETATFETSTLGGANIQPMTPVTVGQATLSFDKGSGSSQPGYFANGNDIRLYANNTVTITAAAGCKVDKVVFTIGDKGQYATVTASLGTVAAQSADDTELTWNGSASSFTLTCGAKNDFGTTTSKTAGQFRFTKVEVTYSAGEGEKEPEQPEVQEPELETLTVAQALAKLKAGENNITARVKGIISEIKELSTSFGNATYFIKDDLSDAESLEIYRGYGLDGNKFTKENEIEVGGTVVVEGKLVDYNGTLEFTTGSKIVSYTAPAGSVNPNPGEGEGEDPVNPPTGAAYTFNFTQPATLTPSYSADKGSQTDNANTYETVTGITFTSGNVNLVATKGTTDARLYYQSGGAKQLRVYKGATLTFTSNGTIESIAFEMNNTTGELTYNGSSYKTKEFTITPNAAEAVVSVANNSQINTITVTTVGGEEVKVAAPVITCDDNTVTITCATEGASIYYDITGANPTNNSMPYTAPFPINENTVIKAIAYKDGDASAVTTFQANYIGTFDSFAEYIANNPTAGGTVTGPITTIYQNGTSLYMKDSKGGFLLAYGSIGETFDNGDQISYISGQYSPFNGLPEMKPTELGTITRGGTPVQPETMTIEELADDILNSYIKITGVTITIDEAATGSAAGRKFIMEDETGEGVLYNTFNNSIEVPEGEGFTVVGFVAINNGNVQVTPVSITEGTAIETVATPTFSPAGGAVAAGTTVTISCATEGATIFYTVDGTEPTIESNEYEGGIQITEAVTIKAIAIKEGMNQSKAAAASYTIFDTNATSAMFDFTDPTKLSTPIEPAEAGKYVSVANMTFTSNAITVAFTDPANTSNPPRLWTASGTYEGDVDLRIYNGDSFTVSAPDGYYITAIDFTKDGGNFAMNASTGTFNATSGAWAPATGPTPNSIKFSADGTTRISTMSVKYDRTTTGVEGITADDNAPAEYYNMQGIRVMNPAAGNMYIVRRGDKVSKVIVR